MRQFDTYWMKQKIVCDGSDVSGDVVYKELVNPVSKEFDIQSMYNLMAKYEFTVTTNSDAIILLKDAGAGNGHITYQQFKDWLKRGTDPNECKIPT